MSEKIILYRKNVQFEQTSYFDPSGRIFYWNERVFREIKNEYAWNSYQRLLKSDLCPKLFEAGLIATWIPDDVDLEGAIGILEHEKIDNILCPAEWTLMMLWEAANMVLTCSQLLSQENYGFKDGHSWNVQFINCKPKWIDFGSITEDIGERIWFIHEFRFYFIIPLWLTKFGGKFGREISYELMREARPQPRTGFTIFSHRLIHFFPICFHSKIKQYEHILKHRKKSKEERYFIKLKNYLNKLKLKEKESHWNDYQSEALAGVPNSEANTILEILNLLNPESVIDFGANCGFYSFEAEHFGCKVILVEIEESCLNKLYKKAQLENRRIIPARIDFLYPTPQYDYGLVFATSFDRLKADVTFVMAIMHHIILRQKCSMEVFTEIISKYSKKASVIEFISPTDKWIQSWEIPIPAEYSKENLVNEMLKRGFSLMHEYDNGPDRDILLFIRD